MERASVQLSWLWIVAACLIHAFTKEWLLTEAHLVEDRGYRHNLPAHFDKSAQISVSAAFGLAPGNLAGIRTRVSDPKAQRARPDVYLDRVRVEASRQCDRTRAASCRGARPGRRRQKPGGREEQCNR